MAAGSTKTAVITAVVTGIFTIIAGLVTYWLTTRTPELSYTTTGSPTLSATTGSKRIYVVAVTNTGRKEIADVLVHISVPSAAVSEFAFEASPGVRITPSQKEGTLDLRADLLNPKDSINASILLTSTGPSFAPRVTVRAPGVSGKESKAEDVPSKSRWAGILSIFAATIATMGGSVTITKNRSFQSRLAAIASESATSSLDQKEVCAFVLGECKLVEEADRVRFSSSDITYRGISDYLLHHADSDERKARSVVALKAIALHRGIAPKSLEAMRDAISRMSGDEFSHEELREHTSIAFREGEDPAAWRGLVRGYINKQIGVANG